MWKTGITKLEQDKILIHGYSLVELMGSCSFGDVVLLMATGKMPYLHQGKLMEAILVSCCDQGPLPPSTNATRFVASCGVPLQAAVAAGILGFGEYHGGAIESCARILQESVSSVKHESAEEVAAQIITEFSDKKKRIPGFGHAYADVDPRAVKLLDLARKMIAPHPHIDLLVATEKKLQNDKGPRLAANINGAVAAVISDLDIDWRMGKGIFIISRSLGLIMHALEEMKLGKPYKKLSMEAVEYIGPEEREVPMRLEPS
ncbi:MAG: citryl-CoA lyase [Deltaproteobacteria bacterium]|nr:citryl-CoA lyase [Deltaproteobacteria bacterium]